MEAASSRLTLLVEPHFYSHLPGGFFKVGRQHWLNLLDEATFLLPPITWLPGCGSPLPPPTFAFVASARLGPRQTVWSGGGTRE